MLVENGTTTGMIFCLKNTERSLPGQTYAFFYWFQECSNFSSKSVIKACRSKSYAKSNGFCLPPLNIILLGQFEKLDEADLW